MADIATDSDELRSVIIETFHSDELQAVILSVMQTAFPVILAQELPPLLQKYVPPIVKAGTADIREKVYRLEILYEDLDDRFRADSELLRENLKVKDQVDDHENRLNSMESTQTLLKDVVTEHSKQLKPKAA